MTTLRPALVPGCRVRANPAYRLHPTDALPPGYRGGLDLSGVFGLLLADAPGLPDKVVDRAGAELLHALRHAGPVPDHAAGRLPELVLDGVLEIEGPDGFVTGTAAAGLFISAREWLPPDTRLGRLSYAAVEYVHRLRLSDVDDQTARLYGYHRVPVAPRWTRAYPDAAAVTELLAGAALRRYWVGPAQGPHTTEWLSWSARSGHGETRFPYKLYLSPQVDAVPDVLGRLAGVLAGAGATRFKVGSGASGLLRPDKIVVYLPGVAELAALARAVIGAFDGVPAHGVPFTAGLTADGLVSWGGDPEPDAGPYGGVAESWRLSVCRRLAEYLTAAATAPDPPVPPIVYALARLEMSGVDPDSFAPAHLAPPDLTPAPVAA